MFINCWALYALYCLRAIYRLSNHRPMKYLTISSTYVRSDERGLMKLACVCVCVYVRGSNLLFVCSQYVRERVREGEMFQISKGENNNKYEIARYILSTNCRCVRATTTMMRVYETMKRCAEHICKYLIFM